MAVVDSLLYLLLVAPLVCGQSTTTTRPSSIPSIHTSSPSPICGVQGGPCCEPTFRTDIALGPMVKCNEGLGCDVRTRTCVSTCGSPGAPCCDGPETRAPAWNSSGSVYTPTDPLLREMCNTGTCDKPSHRCVACSSGLGTACCPPPPNATYTSAGCFGDHVQCVHYDDTAKSGFCQRCGTPYNPMCRGCQPNGNRSNCDSCDTALEISYGRCMPCGDAGQDSCSHAYTCNEGCKPHLRREGPLWKVTSLCLPCGDTGQAPCIVHNRVQSCSNYVDWDRCKPGLSIQDGICQECGTAGKKMCDYGCAEGFKSFDGLCQECGTEGKKMCDYGCTARLKSFDGLCQECGTAGKKMCGYGCDAGFQLFDDLCQECGTEGKEMCDNGCAAGLKAFDGLCQKCGTVGKKMCDNGCAAGLTSFDGLCQECGTAGKKMCNGCAAGFKSFDGLCQECGTEGKRMCDNGCAAGLKSFNGLCSTLCGHHNEPRCDDGTCYPQLQPVQNVCKPCGIAQTPPCTRGGCFGALGVRQNLCALCGSDRQLPCDWGCDTNLFTDRGVCSFSCGWEGLLPCDSGCRLGFILGPQNICELQEP